MKHYLLSGLFSLLTGLSANGQKARPYDSTYYRKYPGTVTARIYASQKYSSFRFREPPGIQELDYRANEKLDLGLGASYNGITLNLGYGFGFLNHKNPAKGATKGLDVQFHLYPYKWSVDIGAIFHNGLYLAPKGSAADDPNSFYSRSDTKQTLVGIAAYRVPRADRFSYHAAIAQSERQLRSAGSVLYGGNIYYSSLRGDSDLVPVKYRFVYPQAGITKINNITIGPGIGYAYTWVFGKYFFITPSLIANLDLNFNSEQGATKNNKFSVTPGTVYKGSLGYNSDTWSLTGLIMGNSFLFKGSTAARAYYMQTGVYRVILARKLRFKKN